MLEETEKYDPRIYGDLRAEYLSKLDAALFHPFVQTDNDMEEEEKRRQKMVEEIKEGKLTIIRP